MKKALISLQNISKSYYSENSVTQALHKINLDFYTGEFVAITGESGGGKSTLLSIIGGMDTFDEGEMFVDGKPTFQYSDDEWEEYRKRKVGYIFQDYSLISHYTVLENVMSSLLILGIEKEEAADKALLYLKKVGLEGFEKHKASELSSGQKQRLSIARALAKGTGIIVADEPTGNLDSETGLQIVKLLKELSKDSLVIMVTHNYTQAEHYVTRKIRLHDGMIISDINVSEEEAAYDDGDDVVKKVPAVLKEKKEHSGLPLRFAWLNINTQKGRSALFIFFFLIVSVISFVLIGELHFHSDEIFTKQYETSAFEREDSTRIVVRKENSEAFTESDIEKIKNISYVESVDVCDYSNDINYYIYEGEDYKYIYGKAVRNLSGGKSVSFINEEKFMNSVSCINEKDLSEGKLPTARNEIVICSNKKDIVGKKYLTYFRAKNIWDEDEYYQTELTVTGVINNSTEKVYFSNELCNMLSMHMDSGVYRMCYRYDKTKGDYQKKPEFIPVISGELSGNDFRVSVKMGDNTPDIGTLLFRYTQRDVEGEKSGDIIEEDVNILADKNRSTDSFVEVSEEFFNKYYKTANSQISVYIVSYAKTDKVLKALEKNGYKGISTYRAGKTQYIENLVNERLIIIGICSLGLMILVLAEVFIIRAMMKIRLKDYMVLKFIGMKVSELKKISFFEIEICVIFAIVITIIAMKILNVFNIPLIKDIIWYLSVGGYIQFILYNIIVGALTSIAFSRLIKRRMHA